MFDYLRLKVQYKQLKWPGLDKMFIWAMIWVNQYLTVFVSGAEAPHLITSSLCQVSRAVLMLATVMAGAVTTAISSPLPATPTTRTATCTPGGTATWRTWGKMIVITGGRGWGQQCHSGESWWVWQMSIFFCWRLPLETLKNLITLKGRLH